MKKQVSIHSLTVTGLMCALCTLLTMMVQVPSPMGGYFNLGDCAVLLSGILLGPFYGGVAAGMGSCLADLLGYPLYAPATLLIKATMAMISGSCFLALSHRWKFPVISVVLGGILAELVMVLGYFVFECFVLGMGYGVAVNIPVNALQGTLGLICTTVTVVALQRTPIPIPILSK